MTRRTGLGRGLDALIPSGNEPSQLEHGVEQIPVDQISTNPRQPRSRFSPEEMAELAASIRTHGVLQPLILTASEGNGGYTLIAGERRLIAARQAGLETVPAVIREATQQDLLEIALIENVQRSDLGPLEAAEAYRQLSDDFGLSHEDISARVGKSRVSITNTLRLLKLPKSVQDALAEGQISEGHARVLLALPNQRAQEAALQTVLHQGLNVRQTEELIRKLSGQKRENQSKEAAPPEVLELEEKLRSYLGTRVSLNHRQRGGTLVIHYYSDEELNGLVDKLLGGYSLT
jgi:ParB family transcriptional regulator, chromosome partitioning protein